MGYKVGDKVLSKIDYLRYLIKGEYYIIIEISYKITDQYDIIIRDNTNKKMGFDTKEEIFSKYFHTKIEERKLKLERLNEL